MRKLKYDGQTHSYMSDTASPFDPLVDLIHSQSMQEWTKRNELALQALIGTRYPKAIRKAIRVRSPDMKGSDSGVPYAGYIHPGSPESGAYSGMSFVIFPADESPCLFGLVIGTQGLAPDEAILGRPGHARKIQAICAMLNSMPGATGVRAWAKQDPTRTDINAPEKIRKEWSAAYERVFNRYGPYLYAIYKPEPQDRAGTATALAAMLDLMFEERGHKPLKEFEADSDAVRSAWFQHLMPTTTQAKVEDLLEQRRYVILQGPPGTGKTTLAQQVLAGPRYANHGRSIQFHPNTTYENFIGGLAPLHDSGDVAGIGIRFAPKPGALFEAAAAATADPNRPYLLHIDEINRADLGKILGEAIFLLEADPLHPREIHLPYDFGPPFHQKLRLPANLHILGTMNSADRSIAIVDVAVRRRFAFLSMWPSLQVVESHGTAAGQQAFKELVSLFIEHAPDDALALVPGHSYFLGKSDAQTKSQLRTTLIPLLTEYLAQGYVTGFAEQIRAYMQWIEAADHAGAQPT
jgi:5-methylcytosine-specific restriction protein B